MGEEQEDEEHKHDQAENGPRREYLGRVGVLRPEDVEEEQDGLLDEQGDDDAVDGRGVDVLVDLGALVGEVQVVAVDAVLHDEIEEAEGGDKRADDGVGRGQRKDQQLPAVVEAERKLKSKESISSFISVQHHF